MEHELRALRLQIQEKSAFSVKLQQEVSSQIKKVIIVGLVKCVILSILEDETFDRAHSLIITRLMDL